MTTNFIQDLESHHSQTRKHIMNGAVTDDIEAHRDHIIELLNY